MSDYHFIGIGGIGMGKLASLLLSKGKSVSGSDVAESAMVQSLRSQGATVMIGHDPGNVQGARHVIYSSAIKSENPEMVAARQAGCLIFKRAQLLAELMNEYETITVAGAHGKTTTTSMIAHMLIQAGLDPTTAIGGVFQGGSHQEKLGNGKYFVAELDESDGSFLYFFPKISVITNIDFEHVDFYGDWDRILDAYAQFIGQTQDHGLLVGCIEDKRLERLLKASGKRFVGYGFSSHEISARAIQVKKGGVSFECFKRGRSLGQVVLNRPGQHNVLNALACIAVGLELELPFAVIKESLAGFKGVRRRFELRGSWKDIVLYDDYAHHPTEIAATLKTAKSFSARRVVAVFQPHRYTRTKFLWKEFTMAFKDADELFVTDIYAASEEVIDGVNAKKLCDEIVLKSGKKATYLPKEMIAGRIVSVACEGDLVITLGAGDITKICGDILNQLNERAVVLHES
ncbi:MAG: UDP-N-acetylmuramate--L-alanine ligase [Candidatus Omnitrophota bacterium]